MEQISQALQNCHSATHVAEIINGGGTAFYTAEQIAGQYAFDAARDAGYGLADENLEAHLEFIRSEGARFDWSGAMEEAKKFAVATDE